MDFRDIKLVIWDLDDTFWTGTISDGQVVLSDENICLIRCMIDCGVMCSICSKNDLQVVQNKLTEHDLWNYFVFPSINWSPKGNRVHQILQSMKLRASNTLFIDDNITNREEVRNACPGISVADVDILPRLRDFYLSSEKKDTSHGRLSQYKLLEEKAQFKALSGSNEEFLQSCNIQVQIIKDCRNHIDRITELITRSNQLNFTKLRSTKEELLDLISDPLVETCYVVVSDKFGDYGIVGFCAVKDRKAIHFTFSCRTLNMGVEQYVYAKIGSPIIDVCGEVASDLRFPIPYWINQSCVDKSEEKSNLVSKDKMVIKGLCDMQQIFSFIHDDDCIIKEFVFVNDNGVSVESSCHTAHIVQSICIDQSVAQEITQALPFGDESMFKTAIFDHDTKLLFLSLLTDPNLGLYRNRENGAIIAFGEYTNDLTDVSLWPKLISKELFVANCQFTENSLRYIKNHYDFIGRIVPEETIRNLSLIKDAMAPDSVLILLLGSEMPFENNQQEAYTDRHDYHKKLNSAVRSWAQSQSNVFLVDTNLYLRDQNDFTNNINHFSKEIYFKISQDLIQLINENCSANIRAHTPIGKLLATWKSLIIRAVRKIHRISKYTLKF